MQALDDVGQAFILPETVSSHEKVQMIVVLLVLQAVVGSMPCQHRNKEYFRCTETHFEVFQNRHCTSEDHTPSHPHHPLIACLCLSETQYDSNTLSTGQSVLMQ